MTTELEASYKHLYETDFVQWIETTVAQLKAQDYTNVDWENLIDEIETMGRSERSSLKSNLVIVLMHLLKWQYQPERRSSSWKGSIVEHRQRIRDELKDSPSLKPYLEQIFAECYINAVERAIAETDLPAETFPRSCPYTLSATLDSSYMPN
ncbi:MAG: DUF29 domain-containing protein [Lyngbya sp. HA4199-MV5]|jgi:flagellar biosynthesis regulator FlaF|nr:DUF29 domain-containing protein [Lyngbya sp. HA4199-MV5]